MGRSHNLVGGEFRKIFDNIHYSKVSGTVELTNSTAIMICQDVTSVGSKMVDDLLQKRTLQNAKMLDETHK